MDNFLIYILESTVCISVFYLLFRLLMRKETSFAVNRATLLTIVVASVIVPLVQLPQLLQTPVHVELIPEFSGNKIQIQNLPVTADVPSVEVQPSSSEPTPVTSELTIPLKTLLRYFYLLGCAGGASAFYPECFPNISAFAKSNSPPNGWLPATDC